MQFDLIVVGAGHAGTSLVKEIRKLDPAKRILMLCQDSGDFYSKPLLSHGFSKQKEASDFIQKTAKMMASELGCTLLAHCEVTAIDPTRKAVQTCQGSFFYQELVLATGAAPIELSLPKACEGAVFSVNDLAQYQTFKIHCREKKQICVLGSGLVGIEYANDLADAGFAVKLITLDNTPLEQLIPPELGQALLKKLQDIGVEFYLKNQIKEAKRTSSGTLELTLSSGETLETELILSAVGLLPRLGLAQKAKLHCHKGLVVNQYLQTADPHIYGLGDCVEIQGRLYMYIQPISLAAKALAQTLTGTPTRWQLPVIPIIVKSTVLPIVSWPPAKLQAGQWQIEGEGENLQAKFYTPEGTLAGFALTGKEVSQRLRLAKEFPSVLE